LERRRIRAGVLRRLTHECSPLIRLGKSCGCDHSGHGKLVVLVQNALNAIAPGVVEADNAIDV
jgi:hypothetical protein